MRWLAVMGVSIAAHALVIVALPPPRQPQPEVAPAPVVTLEAVEAPVMEVVPFEVVVVPATSGGAAPAGGQARATARVASSRAGAATATATETAAPTTSNAFRMRYPSLAGADRPAEAAPAEVDFSVPVSMIAAIIDKPSPGIPAPTGELVANKDGTYTKDDVAYVATIAADGTVKFDDKPNLRVRLALPRLKDLKRLLAEGDGVDLPIITGSFDVTDAVMRLAGQDPYQAKKLAFLDRTRDERVEIGRKHRAEQLEHAEAYVLANADELWTRAEFSIEDKRALLFELWDECAETGSDELVDAGDRARAALLRFIAVHLPAGSADAYTADEVKRLDRKRHSRAHFAPY